MEGSHFELQDGGGPLEIISRITGGPCTMSLGNSALRIRTLRYLSNITNLQLILRALYLLLLLLLLLILLLLLSLLPPSLQLILILPWTKSKNLVIPTTITTTDNAVITTLTTTITLSGTSTAITASANITTCNKSRVYINHVYNTCKTLEYSALEIYLLSLNGF
jgi:hypothetical protein